MKSRRKRLKDKRAFRPKLKTATVFSIVQITFFLLAGLVLISFSRRGLLLNRINEILFSLFSWASIFLPFIFISFAFLVSRFKTPLGQPNVVIGSLLFFVSFVSLTRSGFLGDKAFEGISVLVTPIGAYIVLGSTTLVGVLILFNTSLDQILEFLVRFYRQFIVREGGVKKKLDIFGKTPLNVIGEGVKSTASLKNTEIQDSSKIKTTQDLLVQDKLISNVPGEEKIWKYPPLELLSEGEIGKADRGDIKENAANIEQTLESFGITAKVVEVNLGPAVTQYALQVGLGTKLSKITGLERNLALALAAPTGTIRIEAPIPGRSLVGIELPNRSPEFVPLKKMLESDTMKKNPSKLAVALGLDVSGKPVVADLSRMPHVLIAGQTGSGKSVCINTFLCSMLFRASPSEVKFILVDPKRVELTNYNDIPHLLTPVIVDPKKVISALNWIQEEMERRYKLFAQAGVRNIQTYNEVSGFQTLPYIVLIIDELAEVMLFSPVKVEDAITKIAQMSRAVGIHMVLSTQRPSVEVITGLIKANIPCRIAFAVPSQVDSRVILDMQGAEKLLGRGDMLYLPPDAAKPLRIQGAYVSDKDVNALVTFLRGQGMTPQYAPEITVEAESGGLTIQGVSMEVDELFRKAVELVCQYEKASATLLQRRLSIGYARAARILDQLEEAGVVGPQDPSKPSKHRDVLIRNPEEVFSKNISQGQVD